MQTNVFVIYQNHTVTMTGLQEDKEIDIRHRNRDNKSFSRGKDLLNGRVYI